MARVAVIGEEARVVGFALAGALVLPADDPEAVRAAWRSLDDDVFVVVLTPRARRSLNDETATWPLMVVMPP